MPDSGCFRRSSCARRATLLVALITLAAAWPAGAARAAEAVFDARIGDRVERSIEAGDLHRFLVPVISGTRLKAKLEAETEDPGKDDDDGPPPTLSILSPAGATLATETDQEAELKIDAAEAGTYTILVRADQFAGEYRLDIDGELPDVIGGGSTTVTNEPVAVHVDVPLGSSVRIEVVRLSGGAPRVVAIRDATGRSLGFEIRSASRRRVRLHPVPVTADRGLDIEVGSADAGGGTYDVRVKLDDDDDESPDEDDDREERRVVVQLAPGTDPNALAAELELQFGFPWVLKEVRDGFAVYETPEGREGLEDEDSREAATLIDDIVGAEPDSRARTPEGSQSNGIVLGSSIGRSQFDTQPALGQIGTDRVRGRATGKGVVVAVLDTGIDTTHSVFDGRTIHAGWDFVSDDASPVEEGTEADLAFGHGTFVAGLVLAAAPEAEILPVRVLAADGRGTSSDIAAGIQFAIDHVPQADVINLSLGARARSEVLRGAVREALSHGIVVVASTGNGGDTATIDFPAGVHGVVAVSAVDANRRLPDFANGNRRTALAAPGVDLIGPYPTDAGLDRWGTWSGTSFATALVSGGTALLSERHPTWRMQKLTRVLRRRSRRFGRRVPRSETKALGNGVLDLGKLVK